MGPAPPWAWRPSQLTTPLRGNPWSDFYHQKLCLELEPLINAGGKLQSWGPGLAPPARHPHSSLQRRQALRPALPPPQPAALAFTVDSRSASGHSRSRAVQPPGGLLPTPGGVLPLHPTTSCPGVWGVLAPWLSWDRPGMPSFLPFLVKPCAYFNQTRCHLQKALLPSPRLAWG